MILISIFDKKIGRYGPVYNETNLDTAKRQLSVLVNDATSKDMITLFPSDFELYQLGTFNQESGVIDYKHEFVCNLVDLKAGVSNV